MKLSPFLFFFFQQKCYIIKNKWCQVFSFYVVVGFFFFAIFYPPPRFVLNARSRFRQNHNSVIETQTIMCKMHRQNSNQRLSPMYRTIALPSPKGSVCLHQVVCNQRGYNVLPFGKIIAYFALFGNGTICLLSIARCRIFHMRCGKKGYTCINIAIIARKNITSGPYFLNLILRTLHCRLVRITTQEHCLCYIVLTGTFS